MKHTTTMATACLLAAGVAGMLPAAAQAQAASEDWKFEATLYAWVPSIDIELSFPISGGPTIDVSEEVSRGDVLDALNMYFAGTLEAKKGKFGVWTDVFYADLGGDKTGVRQINSGRIPLPVDITSDVRLDLEAWIWTVAGTYNVVAEPDYSLDLVGGARLLDLTAKLDYSFGASVLGHPLGGRSGSADRSKDFWDAVVGLKGRAYFGDERKWFIPYYVDVGAGQSQLTWQVSAGVGYQFDWGSVLATWRYLDYDFGSGNALQSMNMSGAAIGAAFQF